MLSCVFTCVTSMLCYSTQDDTYDDVQRAYPPPSMPAPPPPS